jgi:hypothetical protein
MGEKCCGGNAERVDSEQRKPGRRTGFLECVVIFRPESGFDNLSLIASESVCSEACSKAADHWPPAWPGDEGDWHARFAD